MQRWSGHTCGPCCSRSIVLGNAEACCLWMQQRPSSDMTLHCNSSRARCSCSRGSCGNYSHLHRQSPTCRPWPTPHLALAGRAPAHCDPAVLRPLSLQRHVPLCLDDKEPQQHQHGAAGKLGTHRHDEGGCKKHRIGKTLGTLEPNSYNTASSTAQAKRPVTKRHPSLKRMVGMHIP